VSNNERHANRDPNTEISPSDPIRLLASVAHDDGAFVGDLGAEGQQITQV
jgi:hypothetical protein